MTEGRKKKIFKGIGITFMILACAFGPISLAIGAFFLFLGGYFGAGQNKGHGGVA